MRPPALQNRSMSWNQSWRNEKMSRLVGHVWRMSQTCSHMKHKFVSRKPWTGLNMTWGYDMAQHAESWHLVVACETVLDFHFGFMLGQWGGGALTNLEGACEVALPTLYIPWQHFLSMETHDMPWHPMFMRLKKYGSSRNFLFSEEVALSSIFLDALQFPWH